MFLDLNSIIEFVGLLSSLFEYCCSVRVLFRGLGFFIVYDILYKA